MNGHPKYIIVIAGPTAIGKTSLAIQLANHLQTEIVSADSRQFYKELDIGVAKPSIIELEAAKHHFIDNISVTRNYTAADYEKDALHTLDTLYKTYNCVVLAGGSGLFINALLNGLDDLPRNETLRNELTTAFEQNGIEPLAQQLQELDKETYNTIDINNPRRVIRALEICIASGKKASELRMNAAAKRNFTPIKIGLDMARADLYNRINLRVDAMVQAGLLDEVKGLIPHRHLNALQTVGYKELFDYFDGNCTLNEAVELIKQHTRNYAKRQLTWFRKDKEYKWFNPSELQPISTYINALIL